MGNQAPITIAPAITINGNADSGVVESFSNNLQEMSNMIIEAIRGNYLDLNNELNLVTQ
jgi:hypothetical protein